MSDLQLINMSDVEATAVQWLWYPYIPFGKLTIMQGDPGEGKTHLILAVTARLTKGEALPQSEPLPPANVIYQTAEDGLSDTIKPRLEMVGADCRRVLVIDESKETLSLSDERIREAIEQTDAKLLILDPLQAYLGANVDMHRANEKGIAGRCSSTKRAKRPPKGGRRSGRKRKSLLAKILANRLKWRSGRDSNPRGIAPKLISSRWKPLSFCVLG